MLKEENRVIRSGSFDDCPFKEEWIGKKISDSPDFFEIADMAMKVFTLINWMCRRFQELQVNEEVIYIGDFEIIQDILNFLHNNDSWSKRNFEFELLIRKAQVEALGQAVRDLEKMDRNTFSGQEVFGSDYEQARERVCKIFESFVNNLIGDVEEGSGSWVRIGRSEDDMDRDNKIRESIIEKLLTIVRAVSASHTEELVLQNLLRDFGSGGYGGKEWVEKRFCLQFISD